jgi:phosphate transport system substrate-binding protein
MLKTVLKVTAAALLFIVPVSGCSKSGSESPAEPKHEEEALSGSITAAGSTALQPLAEKAAAEFMSQHENVSVKVQGGGTKTGLKQVADDLVQIGNSDVPVLKVLENQKAQKLVETRVAALAFALVVNSNVNISNLTTEQVQDIFSGRLTNWKDVGGNDSPIHVINRPLSSGTRIIFEKTLLMDGKANDAIGTIQESNLAVEQAIHSTSGSIGYLAMPYIVSEKQQTLKIIKLDGAEPTISHIITGKYPFWAYQYMVTKGNPKGLVKEYISYIKSKGFERQVEEMGYIPMTKLKQ